MQYCYTQQQEESQTHYAQCKYSNSREHMVYDSTYMKLKKKTIMTYSERKQIWSYLGKGMELLTVKRNKGIWG